MSLSSFAFIIRYEDFLKPLPSQIQPQTFTLKDITMRKPYELSQHLGDQL